MELNGTDGISQANKYGHNVCEDDVLKFSFFKNEITYVLLMWGEIYCEVAYLSKQIIIQARDKRV